MQETYPLELQRRLLESNHDLTTALGAFKSSSDKASRWLLLATLALVVATVVLVILTWALVAAE